MFEFQNLSENEKRYEETPEYENLAKKGLIYVDSSGEAWTSGLEKYGAVLRYQVVPVERARRTKAFDFIERTGTYVQDNGMGSESYTLAVYFIGPGHATAAEYFEGSLALPGPGLLQLPLDVDAVSRRVLMMRYKRTNQFIEGANRTLFDVTFRRTIPLQETLPLGGKDKLLDALDAAQTSLADFNKDALNQAKTKGSIRGFVSKINEAIRSGVDGINSVKNQVDSTLTALDTSIDSVFSQPLVAAQQIQTLLSTPRFTSLTDTVSSYKAIIDSVKARPEQLSPGVSDTLSVQALIGTSACSLMVSEVTQASFDTRQNAVDAFQDAVDAYGTFMDFLVEMEGYTAELPLAQRFRIEPNLYRSTYEFITNACGSLDQRLLGLKREAVFTTEQGSTSINLAAEHYPERFTTDPGGTIALFERTNGLVKDSILFLERGTEYKVLI